MAECGSDKPKKKKVSKTRANKNKAAKPAQNKNPKKKGTTNSRKKGRGQKKGKETSNATRMKQKEMKEMKDQNKKGKEKKESVSEIKKTPYFQKWHAENKCNKTVITLVDNLNEEAGDILLEILNQSVTVEELKPKLKKAVVKEP